MKAEIKNRIEKLRSLMQTNGLSAYLINGSDPHMSEYVPERWQSREYISGFSGSYGWLAITADKATLWTDSRYYLQAGEQLNDTGIEMIKARDTESPTIVQWIVEELEAGQMLGFDGSCYSSAEVKNFKKVFSGHQIEMNYSIDLLNDVWTDRPGIPDQKAFLHPVKWAGLSRAQKFDQIRAELFKSSAKTIVLTALDDIGWTFNLRGADVDCNPVALAYAIISETSVQLFIDQSKLNDQQKSELKADGVELLDYLQFYSSLLEIKNQTVFIDPDRVNFLIQQSLKENNQLIEGLSIPALLKSCKNEAELEGMKKAHINDGLALLDFQMWLEDAMVHETVTEWDVAQKLIEVRSKRMGYVGTSFFPIVGYHDHGAIVHFHVSPESANVLKREGILLFDSGGQYEFGTTDITRTIALGPVTDQMKKDFTLVLKGMIALSRVKFPKGTHGCHLDVLARQALWSNYLNYGHGTGHGVGAFMNVHEGPGSIRPDLNNQQIRLGNVFSNEPGFYRVGEYGIRIENLMYCVADSVTEYGDFYQFSTLTKFPIDTQLIDVNLLTPEEKIWINSYHQNLLSGLSYFTNSDQFVLLKRLTQPI
ncbi:MAG: aminopeptidase P family protein [Prolixibacteraceae bacterium]